jgi:competence protein ComEC
MLQRAQAKQPVSTTRRRPAVPAAILFLVGVAVHPLLPPYPLQFLIGIALLTAAGLVLLRRDLICSILLSAALVLAGATAGYLELHHYHPTDVGAFTTGERQLASLELTLDDPPRVLDSAPSNRPATPRQFARATVRQILTTSGWRPAAGPVLLHLEPPNPSLAAGQTLRVTGWLSRLAPAMNPGQFDFSAHYRRERLVAAFSTRHAGNVRVVSPAPAFAPVTALRAKTRALLGAGFTESAATEAALLRALLLGDRDPALRDVQNLFVRTGTSHHLAISGMHVAVLTGFVYLLCHVLRLHPRTTAYVALSFSLLYAAAALPNPPVVRSVLLCAFLIGGTLLRRHADPVQLLALTVVAMLVYAPLDLYDVGFQLSFGTVLGLMLFATPLYGAMFPVDPDMALAPKRRRPPIARVFGWTARKLRLAIAAAVVAWFISLPMILLHFDRLNPWAILASLVLSPVVLVALIAGLLKVVLTLVAPMLAGVWATGAWAPVWLMHHSVDWLARLPFGDVTLRPVPVPVMLLYYAALLAALLPRLSRRTKRGLVLSACTTILLTPVALTAVARHHPDETRVTILSVGAGSCAVVETNAGQTLVIDAGSNGSADLYRNVIEPFFRTRGLRHVDAAFVSHADYDHYSGLADLARDRTITTTYLTPHFLRDDSPTALALLDALPHRTTLTSPYSFQPSLDTTLDLLWPPADAAVESNDASMVLKLTVAGRSILFPGDVQSATMQSLLADPAPLRSDVLIAPHHGSHEDVTPDFVAAVSPAHIISSDDRTPSRKQRAFDEALPDYDVLHTRDRGAVTVTIRRDGTLAVTPFRP